MSTNHFNAVIIGGGLGGLTAGATLAKFGKKVLVLEQHYIPGGCATTFKRKDYIMEVGLHEMDGLFEKDTKVDIFKFLEVDKNVQFLKVPELFHLKTQKSEFTFPHGIAEAQQTLIAKFPNEEKGISRFFKLINGVLDEIPKMPRERWKQILLFPLMPLIFPNIVKTSKSKVGEWLDKNIKSDDLKLILTANILYYGDDPYNLSLLYFSVAQASYIGGGGHFIRGGSQQLSNYLASVISNNGGQVLLGKNVNKILVEGGVAKGVVFNDAFNTQIISKQINADVVIGNAAIPLIADLLPTDYKEKVYKTIGKMEEACSLISIYMGFNIELKKFGIKHYSTFLAGNDINNLSDIKDNYRGDWGNKTFAFVDYGQVDSGLAPKGKSFAVICAADYLSEWENLNEKDYRLKKEKVAQLFFKRLESQFPGICEHLEYYEVGTSKTIKRYTKNPKGTAYGYAQTVAQSGLNRLNHFPEIKNLKFASAWSFPGGGFTGAILSGFLTAVDLEKNTKWKNVNPQILEDNRVVKLIDKQIIAENTLEMTFEKPKDFNHLIGQYVILSLNQPKHTVLDMPFRSLSIVSHPSEPTLRFAMRISESSFKKSCSEMNFPETATIFGPTGHFSIQDDTKPIVFLVSGIGITPIIPIIKELEKNKHTGTVHLFYSNKTLQSAAYHKLLSELQIPNFYYNLVQTAIESRINIEFLKSKLDDVANCVFYLVGTSEFILSMKEILKSLNVEEKNVNIDDFG
jgi:all-trans-retinol 13,14-reductase